MIRTVKAAAGAAIIAAIALAGCNQGAQPDNTPPRVYILKWEQNPDGTQGAQTTIPAGGSFNVSGGFLAYTQANIRVYGEGEKGVRKFTVKGSATGQCSTDEQRNGAFYTSPGALSASFPDYVETSPPGTTRSFMVFHLDESVLLGNSCGVHAYNGTPGPLEYFLDAPATWTITATAENASGLQTTGTFTIHVQ
jgi:hypothetical protein